MNLKALFPFLLSLLLLTTVILIDRNSFSRMRAYTTQVDQSREVITRLERLSNWLKSAQVYSPSFAQEHVGSYYQLFKEEADQVPNQLHELTALVAEDRVQHQRIDSLSRLVRRHWSTIMQNNITEIVNAGQAWRLNDLFIIHKLINQAIAYENNRLETQKQELVRSTDLTSNASTIFSVLAIGILLAAFASNLAMSYRRKRLEGFLESILNTTHNTIINLQVIRNKNRIVDFRVTFANAAVEDLLAVKRTDIVGKRLSQVSGFLGSPELINRFTDVLETGQPGQFEIPYQKGNSVVWLDAVLAGLDDNLAVTFHDITPIKQYQHELQLNIKQLHRSNDNLQEFAYVASHDLQEPLRKIQAFGDVLQQQFVRDLPSPAVDMIQRMQAASRRMSTLIQDLLTYSRLSAQQAFQPVSLAQLVSEVITDLELLIEEKQAVIQLDSLPTLSGDALQLRQLFQNLLANALKFSRPGIPAEISITCQLTNAPNVSGTPANTHQSFYEFMVKDNGIGFDEQYGDRIFQVFQRLHSRSEFSGTGIGLAICKKVVENHHGYIMAHSKPGQGATFVVYLPNDTANRPPILSQITESGKQL
ncbi:ATP-binding protein [Spirosoma soli]|uniref:histidine kinase n=1 Tax=Spirosoma soli TaxID=1770529 RepID=A0ABW5M710_9BACT